MRGARTRMESFRLARCWRDMPDCILGAELLDALHRGDAEQATDSSKPSSEQGWRVENADFYGGLAATIAWYRDEARWRPTKEVAEAKYAKQGL